MKISLRSTITAGTCCALGLLVAPQVAQANIYAAHLNAPAAANFGTSPTISISYRLNEPATSVNVQIYRTSIPSTIIKTIAGGTNYGLNTVTWDGTTTSGDKAPSASDYSFKVIATNNGYTSWTNITPLDGGNEVGSAQYYAPQGVAVINDINSPDFGCILVANGWNTASSNPGASAAKQGVFVLNNDMSFYGSDANTAYAAGQNNSVNHFDPADDMTPWKIKLGRDECRYYLGDYGTAGATEDLWSSEGPSGSTATAVLQYDGSNHGRVISAKSMGIGSSRQLFGVDRDQDGTGFAAIYRWDIGDTLTNFTSTPTKLMGYLSGENPNGQLTYSMRDLDIGGFSGDLYVVNARQGPASAAEPRVFRSSADATTLRWKKTGNDINGMNSNLTTLPSTQGIAVDEGRGRLAALCDGPVANDGGEVIIMNPEDGTITGWFAASATLGDGVANAGRGVCWDAAGNLYTTNQTDEHLRMWSPPDGANSFTTTYRTTINVTAAPDDAIPPAITSAVSRKAHGTAGSFDVNVMAAGAIECRQSGPTQLVVTFDEAIARLGAANDVTVSSGTISGLTLAGSTLTIDMSGVTDKSTLTIGFAGITDAVGNAVTDTLCMGVLLGDTGQNGSDAPDGVVNIFDLINIKNTFDIAANASNFRNDVSSQTYDAPDGAINIFDLIAVKNNFDRVLSVSCP